MRAANVAHPPVENPKLHAAVESHPNVEKHDVRMGHPADQNRERGGATAWQCKK